MEEKKIPTSTPTPAKRTLSDLTLVELKALAYDETLKIEQSRNNLQVINSEIANKLSQQNTQPKGVATL